MCIHERAKARRLELGLTFEDVAKALNVSKSTVLRYETKEIENMGIDKLEALAKVLLVSPAYLMGWSDKPIPASEQEASVMVKKELAEAVNILNKLSPDDAAFAVEVIKRLSAKPE